MSRGPSSNTTIPVSLLLGARRWFPRRTVPIKGEYQVPVDVTELSFLVCK